ncbi:hypothetical protein Tco_1215546 [Tanacetum coccineum]
MVNSILSYPGQSQGFWGETMLTTFYLLNRVPNKRNMITPYELWTKRKPNLNYRNVWGYRAFIRLCDPKLKTLGERGIECIFVGYADHSKAFRFYVIELNESVLINSIIESMDDIFDENRFLSVPRPCQRSLINGTEDIGGSVVHVEVTEEVLTQQPKLDLRKRKRNRTPKNFGPEFQLNLIEGIKDEMDVKTIFLNGELDEEVYMNQPIVLTHYLSGKYVALTEAIIDLVNEDVAEKPRRIKKKRKAAGDASGSTLPLKKLRDDYGTSGASASTGGKSRAAMQSLLDSSKLAAEIGVTAAVSALRDVDFSLLTLLASQKDTSIADIMDSLFFEGPASETLDAGRLQPSHEQRMLSINRPKDNVRIKGDAEARRLSLFDAMVPLIEPFSSKNLLVLVPPLSIAYYGVVHVGPQVEDPSSGGIVFEKEELETSPEPAAGS